MKGPENPLSALKCWATNRWGNFKGKCVKEHMTRPDVLWFALHLKTIWNLTNEAKKRKIGAYKRRLFSCSQVLWFWGCPQVTLHLSQRKGISRSVMSDTLWPHELQHQLPCPSPTPGVYSNSRPLSQWCHPAISSSVIPFSSCVQFFPASGSFQMSQFFTSGGQLDFSFSISPSLP